MSPSFLSAAFQAATDTVFVASQPTALDVATSISVIVVAVVAILAFLSFTGFLRQMKKVLDRIHDEIKPAAERTRVAAKNVEYISGKVRDDMEKVHEVVDGMTGRLHTASDHMEDRVQEFNALMEGVQGEAERVFIDTARVVRGMQAGAAHVGRGGGPDGAAREYLDPDELETLEEGGPSPEIAGVHGQEEADPLSPDDPSPATAGTSPETEPDPR